MYILKKAISKYYHMIKAWLEGFTVFSNDLLYFIKCSNLGSLNHTKDSCQESLTALYHIIEKGLSMPNRRLGFGQEKMIFLIEKCSIYYKEFGLDSQLTYALSIIKEYDELHKKENYQLENNLQIKIDSILSDHPEINTAKQKIFTKQQYFSKCCAPFDDFSSSRHSMRHFCGQISVKKIEKSIELAKNAPSACNKQPVRIYLVSNQEIKSKILDLQQGNRGFGHNIDKVLIVTTQFSGCTRYSERYMPFIDAGIFSMNLLYSLHFYEIGAIPLVWLNSKKRDNALRRLVGISPHEVPTIMIGIGEVADEVMCANSPRLDTNWIFRH